MRQQRLIRHQSSFPPLEKAEPGGGGRDRGEVFAWRGSRVCVGGRLGDQAAVALAAFSPTICFCLCPASSTVCGREICGRAEPGAALGRVRTCSEGGGEKGGIADTEKAAERCFLPGLPSHRPCCGREQRTRLSLSQ